MTHARAEQINDNGRETFTLISQPVAPEKTDNVYSGTTMSRFEGNSLAKEIQSERVQDKDERPIICENLHLNCLFDDNGALYSLRSVIARVLESKDVRKYFISDDDHAERKSLRRVPTDIHLFGMICLPLQWKGVFKRKTNLPNMLEQLKIMFPELIIWEKYPTEKIAIGWEREKSRFLGKDVDKDNYQDIIKGLSKKKKEDGELFIELVEYIFKSIDNIQEKYDS